MPTSNGNASSDDFVVDQVIRIGMDALSPDDRRIVEDVTSSKARVLAWIADPKKVGKLRPNAPYWSLKITPDLRLIYTQEGDRFHLLDVRHQAWLDRYSSKPSDRTRSAVKNKKAVSSKRARSSS
jgi:Txe/YoeB family toxin of Txe-Axe toxin-antitoxin module